MTLTGLSGIYQCESRAKSRQTFHFLFPPLIKIHLKIFEFEIESSHKIVELYEFSDE